MKFSMIGIAVAAALVWAGAPSAAIAAPPANEKLIARGQYVISQAACNDCHTVGYLLTSGNIPPKDWLTGGDIGFQGPWGTTWGPNLRLTLAKLSEAEWIKMARELRRRPPMPYWVVNEMNEADLKAVYAFIRSLTPLGNPNKDALLPGQQPPPPYFELHLPPPPAK